MEKDEILIRNAILHILDTSIGLPVLSDHILELNPELNDFFRDHIYKIASGDEIKNCCFLFDAPSKSILTDFTEEVLLSVSQQFAQILYDVMKQNLEIPAADFFAVTYQYKSEMFLAFLKMNYKQYYVHYTETAGNGNFNDIMKQTAALPSGSSRLSEAALIKLSDQSIQLVEKKYNINGTKTYYFSQMFLQCTTELSPKAKLNLVTKAVEQINKKYYEDNVEKQMEAKSMIHNDFLEQGSLLPESIGDKLYGSLPEIKEEFTEKLEKYNLAETEVKPQNKQTIKKFEKQFLTTDFGIEINIPMEEYNNKQHIEFFTNPDGTISLLIKNISRLSSK